MPTPEQIIKLALPMTMYSSTAGEVLAQRILRKLDAAGFEVVPKTDREWPKT